ncbi:MAG TPA: LON peptidase substrate-binding domain-containing protein [Acidimicrobiales bacterium]|nr:LON peptidase substrate-binding domain-containing protein [Acidimicrobiales bacterium]
MFPLGIVHFPGVPLPLRVFEPRYRTLVAHCLDGDREFGVVLIERGFEVGGGDARFDVATMTSIVGAGMSADGMVHLQTVGTRRARVVRWLEDDPYPRAEVEDFAPFTVAGADAEALAATERRVRQALAMRAELGEPGVPFNIELDPDPSVAAFQLAAIAPLGPLDKQRLLGAEEPARFVALLDELIGDELDGLALRLGGN